MHNSISAVADDKTTYIDDFLYKRMCTNIVNLRKIVILFDVELPTWSGKLPWRNAKVLDSTVEEIEFELQSRYYFHFRTNTLEKGMNLLITTN